MEQRSYCEFAATAFNQDRCYRCHKTREQHVTLLPEPDTMTECVIDHRSIPDWTPCPQCDVTVEPKLATGEVLGATWGLGRGSLNPRQQARLRGWVGWTDFNGGR